jgi:hypothetical protein
MLRTQHSMKIAMAQSGLRPRGLPYRSAATTIKTHPLLRLGSWRLQAEREEEWEAERLY